MDAGDDVDDVVKRLPLDDEVEGEAFIQAITVCVLPAGQVTDVPLTTLWRHMVYIMY